MHWIDGTRRCEATSTGLRTSATVTVLRTQIIKSLLAAAELTPPAGVPQHATPLDRHYHALRTGMDGVFHELGIAAWSTISCTWGASKRVRAYTPKSHQDRDFAKVPDGAQSV